MGTGIPSEDHRGAGSRFAESRVGMPRVSLSRFPSFSTKISVFAISAAWRNNTRGPEMVDSAWLTIRTSDTEKSPCLTFVGSPVVTCVHTAALGKAVGDELLDRRSCEQRTCEA